MSQRISQGSVTKSARISQLRSKSFIRHSAPLRLTSRIWDIHLKRTNKITQLAEQEPLW